jgi:hypothetical protein
VTDGIDAAQEVLDGEFETVCEREKPESRSCGAGHEAACHLLDETSEQATPLD